MGLNHLQRFSCLALTVCLTSLTFLDCGKDQRPSADNQNSNIAKASVETSRQNTSMLIPNSIYGITVDDIDESDKISDSINQINRRHRITTRIVIDPDQELSNEYVRHVEEISKASDVMALVADSHDMYKFKDEGDKTYVKRVEECFNKLSKYVKIWEIGNEVNGEWVDYARGEDETDKEFDARLGRELPTKTYQELDAIRGKVAKQIKDAYYFISSKGGETALTFYYNEHLGKRCWSNDAQGGNEYGMLKWAEKYVADQQMRDGLKYVFISFYQDDCKVLKGKKKVDAPGFADNLNKLAGIFKNAGVGFGEFAPQCHACEEDRICCVGQQKEFISRYYKDYDELIRPLVTKYAGGYFYWYFLQDMVPKDKPALAKLKEALEG
ncbi:MAG TPA: hypothetical protein VFQ47_10330 [Nitrososphaera sp.]|jgi:hypothetical protein|nr:hypothetical protein [Nitrososphaera sp.]